MQEKRLIDLARLLDDGPMEKKAQVRIVGGNSLWFISDYDGDVLKTEVWLDNKKTMITCIAENKIDAFCEDLEMLLRKYGQLNGAHPYTSRSQ